METLKQLPFSLLLLGKREHIQKLATKLTPQHVVQVITSEQGGEINAKGAAFLHCNRQVAIVRPSVAKTG